MPSSAVGAFDLNSNSQIVGYYQYGTSANGFLYDMPGASFDSFDYPGAEGATSGYGINDFTQIVGDWSPSPDVGNGFYATPQ